MLVLWEGFNDVATFEIKPDPINVEQLHCDDDWVTLADMCLHTGGERGGEERRGEDVFCLVVEFSEVTLMNSLAENIQTKTQLSSIREQARNARWRSWRQRSCQAVSNSTMGPIVCLMMNLH